MEKKDKKSKNLAEKINKKKVKERHHTQFYYSFLTIILLICFIQMSFSALLNVTKVVAYRRKLSTLESNRINAKTKNDELKKEIKNFSTKEAMEAIARNNLKMGNPDEIVLILNELKQTEQQPEKHKKFKFWLFK